MTHDEAPPRYRYGLIREEYSEGGEWRLSYGIAVYAHPRASGSATVIASVHDITSDREALEELVLRCNRGGLSPHQLRDIIDDLFDS